jgi:trimeric autotransporter adhesin
LGHTFRLPVAFWISDGSMVSQWNDVSGQNFHLNQTQGVAGTYYTSTTSELINFNPSVRYTGNGANFRSSAIFSPTSAYTFSGIIIDDKDVAANYGCIFQSCNYSEFTLHKQVSYSFGFNGWVNHRTANYYLTNGVSTTANQIGGNGFAPAGGSSGVWNGTGYSVNNGTQPQSFLITDANTTGTSQTNFIDGYKTVCTALGVPSRTTNWFTQLSIGAYSNGDFDFIGRIPEFFAYNKTVTDAEAQKINTYLALKYGITLGQGGTGANTNINKNHNNYDYISSAAATLWNATANATYNNAIAGIGRDDASGLHQKQSRSSNPGIQVIIGNGTSLVNTNSANANNLTNGQFLLWGDNGLAKLPTVAIAGIANVTHRFAAIWKVQETSSTGTVTVAWPKTLANLTLIRSTDATITSSDDVFVMSNTVTLNGVVCNYATIDFNNGDYFTFAATRPAPGGIVTGLTAWYKANDGTAPGQQTTWADQSGSGFDVTQNNNTLYRPTLKTTATYIANAKTYFFNFNPFYYFDGTNDFFYTTQTVLASTTSPGSLYGVMHNSALGGYTTPYGFGDDDPNMTRNGDQYELWRDNGFGVATASIGLSTMPAHIGNLMWKGSANGIYLDINHKLTSNAGTNIGTITTNQWIIGSNGFNLSSGYQVYQGGLPEVIVYNLDHVNSGGTERQRINSYLAIKYGITIDQTSATNYLSSAAAVIWNGTTNAVYKNNIAGIGRDDASGLLQVMSKSVNANEVCTVYNGSYTSFTLPAVNTDGSDISADNNFLIWGHDGASATTYTTVITPLTFTTSATFYRMNRVYKAQKTGSGISNVTVQGPNFAEYLLIADDASFTTNVVEVKLTNSVGTTSSLGDGKFFTFGKARYTPGGVASPDFWIKSDATGEIATAWSDHSLNDNAIEAVGTWSVSPSDAAHNYYPYTTGYTSARYFDDVTSSLNSTNGGQVVTNVSIFSSIRPSSSTLSGRIAGIDNEANTAAEPGVSLNATGAPYYYKFSNGSGNATYSASVTANKNNVLSFIASNTTNTVSISLNGTNQNFSRSGNGIYGQNLLIGYGTWDINNPFPGDIMEVAWYNRALTNTERDKINSYLGIKNAVTLSSDYLSATGTKIWDQTVNSSYSNDIFGLARDDKSGLFQKQANQNDGTAILYLSTLAASNSLNSGTFTSDNSFVLIGNNADVVCATSASNSEVPSGILSRVAREWKITNTNFGQTFSIDVTLSACAGTSSVTASDLRLLVDNDGVFTDATTFSTASGIGISYSGSTVTFSGISTTQIPANSTRYITIGSISIATPLPVTLLTFDAIAEKNLVHLYWSTATEMNNDYFTIERSINCLKWDPVATVSGAGNSNVKLNYSALDEDPYPGLSYYRLKQTNFDGTSGYFQIRAVRMHDSAQELIYPNPAQTAIFILTNETEFKVEIINILGQVLITDFNKNRLDVSGLLNGMYTIRIIYNSKRSFQTKLVIDK